QRRYSEAVAAADRTLAVEPGNPAVRFACALADLHLRADTEPGHEAAQRILTEDPSGMDAVADMWFELGLCRRDAAEMAKALASLPPEGIVPFRGIQAPRLFYEGWAARSRNDAKAAETAFTAARVELEKIVREQPNEAEPLCTLGMIDAALGRKEHAVR